MRKVKQQFKKGPNYLWINGLRYTATTKATGLIILYRLKEHFDFRQKHYNVEVVVEVEHDFLPANVLPLFTSLRKIIPMCQIPLITHTIFFGKSLLTYETSYLTIVSLTYRSNLPHQDTIRHKLDLGAFASISFVPNLVRNLTWPI